MNTLVEKQRILAALYMEVLYDHEINCRVGSFFDAGWTWSLGDASNGFIETGVADTFVDAVNELWKSAGKHYPRFLENVEREEGSLPDIKEKPIITIPDSKEAQDNGGFDPENIPPLDEPDRSVSIDELKNIEEA